MIPLTLTDRFADRVQTVLRTDRLIISLCLVFCILYSPSLFAWEYKSEEANTTHSAQVRLGADFHKAWHNGLKLGFSQDLRFDAYNSASDPAFRTSFSTLSLAYTPIEYVKLDAGYTLKLTNRDTLAADKIIRHRVFFSLSGIYSTRYVKLSLRERVLMEARTDSVNLLEKPQYNWQLRSRIGADVFIPGKPVKPYLWCELINTLNAPEYQQRNGHQFISQVRTQAGVKWRVSRLSSLDFYYRFTYAYDRDINITRKKSFVELTEETLYQHAVGIIYCLDW